MQYILPLIEVAVLFFGGVWLITNYPSVSINTEKNRKEIMTEQELNLWQELHQLLQHHDWRYQDSTCLVRQRQGQENCEQIYFKVEQLEKYNRNAERYYLAFKNNDINDILKSPLNGREDGWRLDDKM